VSGIGISWVICKSAPRSRQITMPDFTRNIYCILLQHLFYYILRMCCAVGFNGSHAGSSNLITTDDVSSMCCVAADRKVN